MTTSPVTTWITRLTAVQGEARLSLLHELRERPEEYDAVMLRLLVVSEERDRLLQGVDKLNDEKRVHRREIRRLQRVLMAERGTRTTEAVEHLKLRIKALEDLLKEAV